jgi:hypothetical protein
MKKIILNSIVGIFLLSILTGCVAFHSGYMANSAALSQANFSYVKQNIKGEASATYILSILGGLTNATLVDAAKKDMLKSYLLNKNQALVNLTVNFKNSYYLGIFQTVTCTVTADVVEFK